MKLEDRQMQKDDFAGIRRKGEGKGDPRICGRKPKEMGERRRRGTGIRATQEPRGRMETTHQGSAGQKTGETTAQDPVTGRSVGHILVPRLTHYVT